SLSHPGTVAAPAQRPPICGNATAEIAPASDVAAARASLLAIDRVRDLAPTRPITVRLMRRDQVAACFQGEAASASDDRNWPSNELGVALEVVPPNYRADQGYARFSGGATRGFYARGTDTLFLAEDDRGRDETLPH